MIFFIKVCWGDKDERLVVLLFHWVFSKFDFNSENASYYACPFQMDELSC